MFREKYFHRKFTVPFTYVKFLHTKTEPSTFINIKAFMFSFIFYSMKPIDLNIEQIDLFL